ncbi:MAG: aminotransferase class V-fold PLP-dependent enzyme [Phyllobacteriaceae bacterium]|nr:aminotransferase class V-fold PLP-dependent enzyme [Phyllobacteriaceae bacterium]
MRDLFAFDGDLLYADTGTEAPVLSGLPEATVAESTFETVRRAIAPGFGCDADELVVTHNTTDGLCKVLAGLDLAAGDEIVTTTHEHFSPNAALALARDRYGVVIRRVALPVGDDQHAEDYPDLFDAQVTERTRLFVFSSPTFTTGTLLPIKALAQLAQRRGIHTIVDGAHLPGMIDIDCHDLGVDFLVGSGRKWQFGPPDTGLLYIRNKVLAAHNPLPLPRFWPVVTLWYPSDGGLPARTEGTTASYDIAEYLQTTGSASQTRLEGLQHACAIWDRIGRPAIEARLLEMSAHFKRRIRERFGHAALYSPYSDERLHSALNTFTIFRRPDIGAGGERTAEAVRRLEAGYGIRLRHMSFDVAGAGAPHHALRCSVQLFHDHADIDRLIEAAARVGAELDGV